MFLWNSEWHHHCWKYVHEIQHNSWYMWYTYEFHTCQPLLLIACPSGTFGEECSEKCSDSCRGKKCNEITGKCTDGCLPGKTGAHCDESKHITSDYIHIFVLFALYIEVRYVMHLGMLHTCCKRHVTVGSS